MQMIKVLFKKEHAIEVWRNRHLFLLHNFDVSTLVRIYLELYPNSSFKERKKYYLRFIRAFQRYKIHELNVTSLQTWFNEIKNEGNLTEKTLHRIKCQVNTFFKWLKNENILPLNPLESIRFRQNLDSLRDRVLLSPNELRFICENAKKFSKTYFYPVIYTLIHTGARRTEVVNLRWRDIDFENNMILFQRTKNGETRKIKMSPHLRQLLDELPKINPYIFQNFKGKKASGYSTSRAVQRFKKNYPMNKDWRMHDLRHSFAYNFLMNGGEMYQLQAILGHKSIKMTVDLYGKLKAQDISKPSPYNF